MKKRLLTLLATTPPITGSDKVKLIEFNGQELWQILQAIVNWVLGFAGALGVLAIIYSGLLYITSGSNPERQQKAKKALTYAIYGIIIVVVSYLVVALVTKAVSTVTKNVDAIPQQIEVIPDKSNEEKK